MNDLTITGCAIRQDSTGRYCLNDLHKASGGLTHHRPSKWLVTKQAQGLIKALEERESEARIRASLPESQAGDSRSGIMPFQQEFLPKSEAGIPASPIESQSPNSGLGIAPIDVIHGGEWNGTYVAKQLVYAYAMWISPEFHLHVIEAYDALVTGTLLRPNIQHENYWFTLRPHWLSIREQVLAGLTYKNIATLLEITVGRVRYAVLKMIKVGLLDPAKVATVQRGPARRSAKLQAAGWGLRQLNLWPEVQA